MNISELNQERARLRAQLRRAAIDALNGAVALDLPDLVARVDQATTGQYSPVIRHRLMLRGLLTVWPHRDQLAAALGLELAELDRLAALPLLADPAPLVEMAAEIGRRFPATLLTLDALDPADREQARSDPEVLMGRS